jgi:hypothetical protein
VEDKGEKEMKESNGLISTVNQKENKRKTRN